MRPYPILGTALFFTAITSFSSAATVLLISENFADGVAGPTPAAGSWVGSSGLEIVAGTGFATARALATTYDHDNNGGTANINIPGGLEVNNSTVSTLTITVTMPVDIDSSTNGVLNFWAAVRANNATGAAVRIRNVTDNIDVVAATTPTFSSTNTNWQSNSFSFAQSASYAGDTFQVIFNGGGSNGANGLELTDISFAVQTIPEPATAGFTSLAALGLLRRKRRA